MGACWCCALKLQGMEDKLVCTDGPAFDLTTVEFK
ncbi:MAG: hypothetical protein U0694_29320 [Anaerolineae bacterium]